MRSLAWDSLAHPGSVVPAQAAVQREADLAAMWSRLEYSDAPAFMFVYEMLRAAAESLDAYDRSDALRCTRCTPVAAAADGHVSHKGASGS